MTNGGLQVSTSVLSASESGSPSKSDIQEYSSNGYIKTYLTRLNYQ